ncbi:MAG: DHH family phosphoesterase [Candidatus Saccharimonadales bacterium]
MQDKINELVQNAQKIVVVQADNPDADSLGSALALEHILGDMGKDVYMYCGVDVPSYLRYLPGWDRVLNEFPSNFDLSIIVDADTYTLLGQLNQAGQLGWLKAKPCVVLDHHPSTDKAFDFTTTKLCDDTVSSTGELIYQLSQTLNWPINVTAGGCLMTAILGDTQGLANDLTKPSTYRAMAELTELGVNRPQLEEQRRELSKMPAAIYKYKGTLIAHTEFAANGTIAYVLVPQAEINEFSPMYNPAAVIQFDMLQTTGVQLAIVFKTYDSGRITAALKANTGYGVAGEVAEKMGGGGHPYASGFKVEDGRPFNKVKSECIELATQLLNNLTQE